MLYTCSDCGELRIMDVSLPGCFTTCLDVFAHKNCGRWENLMDREDSEEDVPRRKMNG